jgi:hypothetical protein
LFLFFSFLFFSFLFFSFLFFSFRFVSFRFVSFRFVSFLFVSFRFVSFRFVSFRFVSFRFVSFRFVCNFYKRRCSLCSLLLQLLWGGLTLAHWLGCGFYFLARTAGGVAFIVNATTTAAASGGGCESFAAGGVGGESAWSPTWLSEAGWHDAATTTVASRYLHSLYWALSTLTVVCFGDIVPLTTAETVWTIATTVCGFFLVAALVGNIAAVVTKLNKGATQLAERLSRFDVFTQQHALPPALAARCRRHFAHAADASGGVDEERVLKTMPASVRAAGTFRGVIVVHVMPIRESVAPISCTFQS